MKYLLLISVIVFASANALAQARILPPIAPRIAPTTTCPWSNSTPVPILTRNPFKIKAASTVSSENARVADYIEFQTMESIYSKEIYPTELFKPGQSIFGIVTWRKHRSFPVRGGKIEIALKPLVNWDGTEIQMGIKRHGSVRPEPNEAKRRSKPCDKALDPANCVAGRRNWKVSPVVGTIAGAAAGTVGVLADDDDDDLRFFAATTFFSMAKELAELLNGQDADIKQGEIFDLYIDRGSVVCSRPEKDKPKPGPTEIKIVGPVTMEMVKPEKKRN